MSLYLYGIIPEERSLRFGAIGFDPDGRGKSEVFALPGRKMAAVVGKVPFEHFEGLGKEKLVRALLAYQQTLEIVMKERFVLPCKFGTFLKDEAEALRILSQNNPLLSGWLERMKEKCEMNVIVTWDPEEVLKSMAEKDPDLIAAKARFQKLQKTGQNDQKNSLGIRLSAKLREAAEHLSGEILGKLGNPGEPMVPHGMKNDAMVMNASFLIPRTREGGFFEKLNVLDKNYGGQLHFKYIGPLPPYSFACLTLQRFDPKKLKWALDQLGLNENADTDEMRQAYKCRAKACHPDTHPESGPEEFELLRTAYEYLADYCAGNRREIKISIVNLAGENG